MLVDIVNRITCKKTFFLSLHVSACWYIQNADHEPRPDPQTSVDIYQAPDKDTRDPLKLGELVLHTQTSDQTIVNLNLFLIEILADVFNYFVTIFFKIFDSNLRLIHIYYL